VKVWENNVLRSVAKAVIAESQAKTKGVKAQGDRDRINKEIIDRHHKPISAGFTRIQLLYTIGVVRGVLKDRG